VTDLDTFLEDLSSGSPVPGGGSVAALETCMGSALLGMVANLTVGRKRYAGVQDRVLALRERAGALRARARELVDEDAAAYAGVSTAMRLPRSTDDEKNVRTGAIQEALKAAAVPPLETMGIALDVVALAEEMIEVGNQSAASDVGTAAGAALAGFEAARLNVEINLASVSDTVWAEKTRVRLERMESPQRTVQAVIALVESIIRGEI
jgi:methenyltetrahydrofolate cyclohydrolase